MDNSEIKYKKKFLSTLYVEPRDSVELTYEGISRELIVDRPGMITGFRVLKNGTWEYEFTPTPTK